MDIIKLEKKLDKVIKKTNKLVKQNIRGAKSLVDSLEDIKGDIIVDDIVRMSGQSRWREKQKGERKCGKLK
jgi:hypothetical protein